MDPVKKKVSKVEKKEQKKRVNAGEWSIPPPEPKEVLPKIERFNWADEA